MKRLFSILLILLCLCSCHKETTDSAAPLTDIEKAEQSALPKEEPPPESAVLPVLMYHDFIIGECQPNTYTVSAHSFERQLSALDSAGYTAVTPDEVYGYLNGSAEKFPKKPILITFDDGYKSNLDIAAPILKRHRMKATVFVVGNMVGKKEEGMIPRFDFKEAAPYVKDGVIDIQSHTHSLHDMSGDRQGVLIKEGESHAEYEKMLSSDISRARDDIKKGLGRDIISVSYPFGFYSEHSAKVLEGQNIPLQFTSDYGVNEIRFGEFYGHRRFNRISVGDEITPEMLINMINATE